MRMYIHPETLARQRKAGKIAGEKLLSTHTHLGVKIVEPICRVNERVAEQFQCVEDAHCYLGVQKYFSAVELIDKVT